MLTLAFISFNEGTGGGKDEMSLRTLSRVKGDKCIVDEVSTVNLDEAQGRTGV